MQIPKEDEAWVKKHAEYEGPKGWKCKKTGARILYKRTGRSIWIARLNGGFGEVRQIRHLYCPECQPDFQPPAPGTPIQEDDLVQTYDK